MAQRVKYIKKEKTGMQRNGMAAKHGRASMRRHFRWDKKYLYWGVTAFCVIAAAILFYMALHYLPLLRSGLSALVGILSPFIWGLVICYLLSPLMNLIERKALIPLAGKLYRKHKKKDGRGLARGLAVLFSEIVFVTVIAALIGLIIPQLFQSLETIVNTSPQYISNAIDWLTKLLNDYPVIEQYVTTTLSNVSQNLVSWINTTVLTKFGSLLSNLTSGVYGVARGLYNLIIGIIVSVYILSAKEKFAAGAKRVLYSIFTVEAAQKILEGLDFTDKTFMGFINGKLLDSAIIGLICYIGCALLRMPYTLLVSIIVGVTNVIPFFGPFIGAVPCTLIILLVEPMKGLIFVLFVILLQQLDGNIIGPKILGNSTGITGFWVMFSIILGAGLFGFWGMLLGVPVFVMIYTLINSLVEKKLKRSELPYKMEDYIGLDYIDPVTYRPVKGEEPKQAEKEKPGE